ncbi:MAG: hypothetical protein LBM74_04265 [Oscillospiraceae bacterium]|jgi:hypothetical protein|nr:hypothetical protein [Oscillospiraceae bacterium]
MEKKTSWDKVIFAEKKPDCVLTFRPNGQIMFDVDTLNALKYPKFVDILINPNKKRIAIKVGDNTPDALQLTATELPIGEPRTIMAVKAYRWLCGLLGQNPGEVSIKLIGTPEDEGMVVYKLDEAIIAAKRIRHTKTAEAEA